MALTFKELRTAIRDALPHLYDPTYEPAEILWLITGCQASQGVRTLQSVLMQAIRDLEPTDDVPPGARSRRLHQLLSLRYLHQQTQERAADHLGITARHLRREQNEALELLARQLWQQRPSQLRVTENADQDSGWRTQLAVELQNLQQSAPGAIADVTQAIQSAIIVGQDFLGQRGFELEVAPMRTSLSAAIHPAAIRQILISCLRQLSEVLLPGKLKIEAVRADETVRVLVYGTPLPTSTSTDNGFIEDILVMHGGSLKTTRTEETLQLQIEIPLANAITVLVIDDNDDLVHFYRRYTTGTRYHIVHEREGLRVFDTIESMAPDVIVLDIMLPDIDGWELLSLLYESIGGRAVPIIVCSVVREEELALSLGAALYLPKPVRRVDFVRALDRALSL